MAGTRDARTAHQTLIGQSEQEARQENHRHLLDDTKDVITNQQGEVAIVPMPQIHLQTVNRKIMVPSHIPEIVPKNPPVVHRAVQKKRESTQIVLL
jgi:hypothetical protein